MARVRGCTTTLSHCLPQHVLQPVSSHMQLVSSHMQLVSSHMQRWIVPPSTQANMEGNTGDHTLTQGQSHLWPHGHTCFWSHSSPTLSSLSSQV
jgi:hypothetical protein